MTESNNGKELKTFSLISMCTCRDAFWIGNNTYNRYNFKVNNFWQNISPFSTLSNRIDDIQNLDISEISWGTPWQRKCLNVDIQKNIIEKTDKTSDYLIIDIGHTQLPLASWSNKENCFLTIDQPFTNNKDFLLNKISGSFNVLKPVDFNDNYINECLDKYLEEIKKYFDLNKIILCEFYNASKYFCEEQNKILNYESIFTIREKNKYLKKIAKIFKEKLKGCHIIKMPENAIGYKQHRWGHNSMHFCDNFYDYVLSAIDIICANYDLNNEMFLLEKLRNDYSDIFTKKTDEINNRKLISENKIMEKTMEEKNSIIIKKPYIQIYSHANGDILHRLNAEIIENGKHHVVYVEVQEEYGKYLCDERGDAFLYLVLPVAMREKYDIYCEVPVTDQLLHNINEILLPHLVMGDSRLYAPKIHCETVTEIMCGGAVGTAISCGVDSMYTVMEHTNGKYPSMQLTHLYISSLNAELWDTKNATMVEWMNEHPAQFERFNTVSKELNLPLVALYSNFADYVCLRDWKVYHHLWVHQYITMGSVLALKKFWKMYLFSSSTDFTHFKLTDTKYEDPDKYILLAIHVLSQSGFSCYCGGAKTDRIEKTRLLADYKIAQKTLHPCHSKTKMNCSEPTCPKCLRAFLTLDYYDKLDNMKAVFDIDRYRNNKSQYFFTLAKTRKNEYISGLYDLMKKKYPKETEKAVADYENTLAPVPKPLFDNLKGLYDIILELLSLDNPKQFFINFFKSKGIKKLYTSGNSLIGDKIINFIKNDIEIKNYNTGKATECDAAFITITTSKEINGARYQIQSYGLNKIYTIYDIYNEYLKNKK